MILFELYNVINLEARITILMNTICNGYPLIDPPVRCDTYLASPVCVNRIGFTVYKCRY